MPNDCVGQKMVGKSLQKRVIDAIQEALRETAGTLPATERFFLKLCLSFCQ